MSTIVALFLLADVIGFLAILTVRRSLVSTALSLIHFMLFYGVLLGSTVVITSPVYFLLVLTAFVKTLLVVRHNLRLLPADALKKRGIRSLAVLSALFYSLLIVSFMPTRDVLVALTLFLSGISSLMLGGLLINRFRWRYHEMPTTGNLPTVSVCIPARNETADLPACIESVLSSTYPKLEILVLDDCSHDKTPLVIKQYAHDGVRFISGSEPTAGWLAKNKAMEKLFDESLGDIVVFCGVDVRMSKDTIAKIVSQLDGSSAMISILPTRDRTREWSIFIQPLRYWWELALLRGTWSRPPVLSTLWAIKRPALAALGSFEGVRSSVQPEAHFAKRLASQYRFVIASQAVGITSAKLPSDQYETAVRLSYPQLHRRVENVALLTLLLMSLMVVPLYGIFQSDLLLKALALSIILTNGLTSVLLSKLVVEKSWPIGLAVYPFLCLQQIFIMIRSAIAYESSSVTWKQRNICLPMLSVLPALPAVEESKNRQVIDKFMHVK